MPNYTVLETGKKHYCELPYLSNGAVVRCDICGRVWEKHSYGWLRWTRGKYRRYLKRRAKLGGIV